VIQDEIITNGYREKTRKRIIDPDISANSLQNLASIVLGSISVKTSLGIVSIADTNPKLSLHLEKLTKKDEPQRLLKTYSVNSTLYLKNGMNLFILAFSRKT